MPSNSGTGPQTGRASWNPLDCRGTALPAPVLLAVKLLVLYLLVHGHYRFRIYLPFIPWLDLLRPCGTLPELYRHGFVVLAGLLLLNRRVRTICFLLGAMKLLAILACRPCYSNNQTFFGCFLLLAGLSPRAAPPIHLRFQVILVYFGAGLNKLLDPDWRSGQFFEHWTHQIHQLEPYIFLAGALPEMMLSQLMGWLTLVVELGLALGLLIPRTRRAAIRLGLGFHVGMLIFTGGVISWVFCYAMACAYLVFLSWPTAGDPEALRWRYRPTPYVAGAALFLVVQHLVTG